MTEGGSQWQLARWMPCVEQSSTPAYAHRPHRMSPRPCVATKVSHLGEPLVRCWDVGPRRQDPHLGASHSLATAAPKWLVSVGEGAARQGSDAANASLPFAEASRPQ